MDWLKSQWASWKVKVSVVGGVLVVATAYGSCEVDPAAVSTDTTTQTEITGEVTETIEVSATAPATGEGVIEEVVNTEDGVDIDTNNTGDGTTTTETTTE